jgi:tetratricopeptide (TPR) repeat protein
LIIAFIITGLMEAIWGLRQLYGFESSNHNLFRITGSFLNPGPYACYIAVVMPAAFYYFIKYRICYKVKVHIRNIPIYLIWGVSTLTTVASILILPATMSRTAWIAAIAGCGFMCIHFLLKNRHVKRFVETNKRKFAISCSVLILLASIGLFGMYSLKKDSADGRSFIWKNTIELIKQNPFGVGIGNFSGSYGHVQATYFEAGKGTESEKRISGNPEYAFNEYLQICAEQGVLVFMVFISIIAYSLYIGFKNKKTAPTASLIALLTVACFSYPFSLLPFLIVFVFLLALINSNPKGKALPKYLSVSFFVLSLCIVSFCFYKLYPVYNAQKKWDKLKISYNFGNHSETIKEYSAIYPFLSDQIQFLFEYAQSLNKTGQYNESSEVLEKAVKISCDPMLYNIMGKNYHALKRYKDAEKRFVKASNIVPNRIYPYYLLALMYMDAGETEKAREAAQTVLTKEPKVQSTAIREMRSEMSKFLKENE